MIVLVLASIIALLLVYTASPNKKEASLKWAIGIVTLVSAVRYQVGTDYMNYYEIYDNINSYGAFSWNELIQGEIYKDPMWTLLNLLFSVFKDNGFFVMVAAISIFQNVVVYYIIKKHVTPNYWPLALFVYLFNPYFYVLDQSMLRQGLAISLCMLAFLVFSKKKLWLSILLIVMGWLTHSSALIMLCIIPILFWKMENTKPLAYIFTVSFVLFFIFRESLDAFLSPFLAVEDFDILYEKYLGRDTSSSFGIIFILNTIPFLIFVKALFKGEIEEPVQKQMLFLSCIGTLIIPFSAMVQMISRLALYFNIFSIAAIPIVYSKQNSSVRTIITSCYVLAELTQYYLLYLGPSASRGYDTYQTILEIL